MSKRKPARRRSSAKSSGGSLWSWLALLGLAVGGIQVYEHRDTLMPKVDGLFAATKTTPSSTKPATREASIERPKIVRQSVALPPSGAPIPPRSVGSVSGVDQANTAAVPAQRPQVETVALTAKPGNFAFCGRSGLSNCVADGNTFWMKGVKMKLAGIEVPQTDNARCMEERARGFSAKVRLRDMLNAGGFQVASAGGAGEEKTLSRGGVSFADQLLREGLARRAGSANSAWCR